MMHGVGLEPPLSGQVWELLKSTCSMQALSGLIGQHSLDQPQVHCSLHPPCVGPTSVQVIKLVQMARPLRYSLCN